MAKMKKSPELRFKGFLEGWEERKLGEVLTVYPFKAYLAEPHANGKYKVIQQGDMPIAGYADGKAFVNYDNITLFGDHTLSLYKATSPFFVASDGLKILSSPELDGLLLFTLLDKYKPKSEGYKRHFNILKEVKVCYPKNINEQSPIGSIFKNLDALITLHQRKHDKLCTAKKAMLEKMFPKEGADVPEIRFKGFTGKWERRKLDSIFSKIKNAFVGTASPYYVEEGHFYLESNNVKNGQINRNTEIFINDEFYQNQKDNWLHTGDLVMVQSGHVGHSAVIPQDLDNTAAHALIFFTDLKDKINSHFLNYQFLTTSAISKIEKITTGNTIKHILSSDMKVFSVSIPTIKEQDLIANIFRDIDTLISLHQRETDKLKSIKKACLEKMFV